MLLVTSVSVPSVCAHDGHTFGNPFHPVPVRKACLLARREHKLVFVYATAPGKAAPTYLERPSWRHWRALDLLIREAVAVKVNGADGDTELSAYESATDSLPLILLLDADGRELHRLTGDVSVDELNTKLTEWLSDAGTLERARRAAANANSESPIGRERLAAALARSGQIEAALDEYKWCVNVAMVKNPIYANARRRFVCKTLVALAAEHPQARTMVARLQNEMEHILLHERDHPNIARNVAELNLCLGQPERTLSLYDRLPERSRAKQILFDSVIDQLVQHRRYEEVLATVEPLQAFRQEVIMARSRRFACAETPDMRNERGTKTFAVARGAMLVEALAASDHTDEAEKLLRAILRFQDDDECQELLMQHIRRSGCGRLLELVRPAPTGEPDTTQP